MTDSILQTTKLQLGITEDMDAFDDQIILCINSAISSLQQIGVDASLVVTGADETWTDYIGTMKAYIQSMVKNYIAFKVRMMFDPPSSGTMNTAVTEQLNELTNRISWYVDHGDGDLA